jgi:hypothetical protein
MAEKLGSLSFSEVLDRSLRLYRRNFGPWLGFVALLNVPFLPFALAMADPAVAKKGFTFVTFLAALFGLLVMILEYGTITVAAHGAYLDRPVPVRAAFRRTAKRFWSLLGGAILVGLATLGATMALVIPGFYVWTGFAFYMAATMVEDLGAMAALRRSWALAKGVRLRQLGVILALAIIALVLEWGTGALVGLLTGSTMAKAAVTQLLSMLVVPVFPAALVVLYVEARANKEGLDLQLEAERVLSPPAPGA